MTLRDIALDILDRDERLRVLERENADLRHELAEYQARDRERFDQDMTSVADILKILTKVKP